MHYLVKIIYELFSILSWKWSYGWCKSKRRLDNKTVVITGANSGIGLETTLDLYTRGANVIMACRSLSKTEKAIKYIKSKTFLLPNLGKMRFIYINLNSMFSVKECALKILQEEKRIDILINNAGVMMSPYAITEDGFEEQFSSNYVGHFLLTIMLLPTIIRTSGARIIMLSSLAHYIGHHLDVNHLKDLNSSFGVTTIYCQTKLACLLFAKELANRLKVSKIDNVYTYAVHPGVIVSNLGRYLSNTIMSGGTWLWFNLGQYILKSPWCGAQTTIYCAVDENCANETGLYYCECAPVTPSVEANDPEMAKQLWETTWKELKLPKNYNPFNPNADINVLI